MRRWTISSSGWRKYQRSMNATKMTKTVVAMRMRSGWMPIGPGPWRKNSSCSGTLSRCLMKRSCAEALLGASNNARAAWRRARRPADLVTRPPRCDLALESFVSVLQGAFQRLGVGDDDLIEVELDQTALAQHLEHPVALLAVRPHH